MRDELTTAETCNVLGVNRSWLIRQTIGYTPRTTRKGTRYIYTRTAPRLRQGLHWRACNIGGRLTRVYTREGIEALRQILNGP